MARCGCGGACSCALVSGANTTVTGSGTPANPWVVNASTDCPTVRTCVSAGPGVNYNSTTGVISADVSGTAGNTLTIDGDGLYVPASSGQAVTTGCGLTGNGTAGTPLAVNVSAWPYPCAIGTAGGVVSCDPATGRLYSDPKGQSDMKTQSYTRTYPNILVPAGVDQSLDTFVMTFTNDDPCHFARVIVFREVDVRFDMPGTGTTGPSRAAYTIDTNETYRQWNNGVTGTTSVSVQTARSTDIGTVGPSTPITYTLDVRGGQGLGGATYTSISVSIRALFISTAP